MLQLTVESGMGATWMNDKSSTTESFSYGSKKSHWEFNDSRIFWIQVNTIKQKKKQKFLKIFRLPEWNEGNFKIFKYHECDLSQKLPEPNMWLLVNYTKPTNILYWN